MRVLMLSWEYPPHIVGGLGKHVADLLPALARCTATADDGIVVHLLTPTEHGDPGIERNGNVTVHRIASYTDAADAFLDRVDATNATLCHAAESVIAQEEPFDLIHNHDWLTAPAAWELKHAFKLPLVGTIHATERGRGRGHLYDEQSHRIDAIEWRLNYESWRVICCANYMAGEVHDYFGTPLDKVDVIPNGVDPTPFLALEGQDLSALRARYARPDDRIVFFVGRLVHEKGVDTLVRAAPAVLAGVPQARFIIAGRGPEMPYLQGLVHELGLGDRVQLAGFVSDEDRNRLLRLADCAVFPSLYEPFGIVALEAMAAHCPVVVSEVGGLREVVRHAETGITIYPGNVDSCAWGIRHTLEHPDWARQRADNAFRDVLTIFSWDTIAAQTARVYQRVVHERTATLW